MSFPHARGSIVCTPGNSTLLAVIPACAGIFFDTPVEALFCSVVACSALGVTSPNIVVPKHFCNCLRLCYVVGLFFYSLIEHLLRLGQGGLNVAIIWSQSRGLPEMRHTFLIFSLF
jgi:hypothetical protein